jgi:hypothetical protein
MTTLILFVLVILGLIKTFELFIAGLVRAMVAADRHRASRHTTNGVTR